MTHLPGPRHGEILTDECNKAVVKDFRIAFAFTGISEIDKERADYWLCRQLIAAHSNEGGDDLKRCLERIANAATLGFARLRKDTGTLYRHAFVGAGWAYCGIGDPEQTVAELCPIYLFVSNALNQQLRWTAAARDDFNWGWGFFRGKGLLHLSTAGQNVRESQLKELRRNIVRLLRAGAGPQSAARLMVEAVREVARSYKSVGNDVMVSCVPRQAVANNDTGLRVEFGPPNRQVSTFHFVSGKREVAYGPQYVHGNRFFGDWHIDAPAGINPITGTINMTGGSVIFRTGLGDAPAL
ncbi:MAG: hypothetical protein H0W40_03765 [Methylibium sp.]|uniref:hypothetical protein n=1 Tax=Methylibium sp. TaxID=2067992 RepID=UPI00184C4D9A|nr:hypothetical protein [Methylibium sp.]MBA3596478.1 hypothetical protein [Methylibium sp.]